jgi:uncharacterized membrane protein
VTPTAWEVAVGIPLLFFVPGYAVAKALFPEWRVRGVLALRRALEIATLAFVLSVVLTVLVGWALLDVAPSGFQASWSDPVLESILAAVALIAFVAGLTRGAYAREPPAPSAPEPDVGEENAWELTRRLDDLAREERRLRHALRASDVDRATTEREIERLRAEQDALGREREVAYGR